MNEPMLSLTRDANGTPRRRFAPQPGSGDDSAVPAPADRARRSWRSLAFGWIAVPARTV